MTAICIILSAVTYVDPTILQQLGICKGCSVMARISYPFLHASITHAIINCWCLISIVFTYDITTSTLFTAYLIAITYPINTIARISSSLDVIHIPYTSHFITPTVGLSAVCFALLAIVSFQVRDKRYFHTFVLSFIAIGFVISHVSSVCGYTIAAPNNTLHLYCYIAGLIIGFLNSPAPWQR